MVIYIDVLIIENVIVNYFMLLVTAKAMRVKTCLKYALPSAILGSLYVFSMLIPSLYFLNSLPIKIVFPLLMMLMAYRKKEILFNIKAVIIYILISMAIAGLCYFIEIMDIKEIYLRQIGLFSIRKLMLAVIVIYLVLNKIILYLKERKEISQLIYEIDIFYEENKITIEGFLDTGNGLREPVTNLPVLIVEKSKLKNYIINENKKYYIPYQVINGGSGLLEGFIPDYIALKINGQIEKREVIIAISDKNFKDYDGLLSRGII